MKKLAIKAVLFAGVGAAVLNPKLAAACREECTSWEADGRCRFHKIVCDPINPNPYRPQTCRQVCKVWNPYTRSCFRYGQQCAPY
jgi:hypothetical protein